MELSQIIFPACEGEPGLPAALWDKTYDDKSSSAPIRICSAPPLPSCPLPSVSHMSSYLPPAHLSFSFFAVLRLQKPRLFPLREGRLLGNGKQNCGPANTGARPGGAALTHITLRAPLLHWDRELTCATYLQMGKQIQIRIPYGAQVLGKAWTRQRTGAHGERESVSEDYYCFVSAMQ